MKQQPVFIVLVLATIATSLFIMPASAGSWVEDEDYDEAYEFWVWAYAAGYDVGDYFSDYVVDWDHGPTMDSHRWYVCYYDHMTFLTYDEWGRLFDVEKRAWGNIYERAFGIHEWTIKATAWVNAGLQ